MLVRTIVSCDSGPPPIRIDHGDTTMPHVGRSPATIGPGLTRASAIRKHSTRSPWTSGAASHPAGRHFSPSPARRSAARVFRDCHQLEAFGQQRLEHLLQRTSSPVWFERRQLPISPGIYVEAISAEPCRPTDDLRVAHPVAQATRSRSDCCCATKRPPGSVFELIIVSGPLYGLIEAISNRIGPGCACSPRDTTRAARVVSARCLTITSPRRPRNQHASRHEKRGIDRQRGPGQAATVPCTQTPPTRKSDTEQDASGSARDLCFLPVSPRISRPGRVHPAVRRCAGRRRDPRCPDCVREAPI